MESFFDAIVVDRSDRYQNSYKGLLENSSFGRPVRLISGQRIGADDEIESAAENICDLRPFQLRHELVAVFQHLRSPSRRGQQHRCALRRSAGRNGSDQGLHMLRQVRNQGRLSRLGAGRRGQLMAADHGLDPFQHPADQGFDRRHDRIVVPEAVSPGEDIRVVVRIEPEGPWRPRVAFVGGQKELVLPLERVADRRERMAGRAVQRLERDPHEGEGVVVGSRPDVKSVLLDPLSVLPIASARRLAPEAPAELVHRDLVFFSLGIDFRQRERSAHGAYAAA